MGFFSWNCKGCGHPMLSGHATNSTNDWMTDVVVQFDNGTRLIGEYDGYGRVNDKDFDFEDDPECYHKVCWDISGKPRYSSPSENASDQGFFFEKEHDMPEPSSVGDLKAT